MEVLIYGTHPTNGYCELGHSKNFPSEFHSYVLNISKKGRNPLSPKSSHNISFRPLPNGLKYLLTVTIRNFGKSYTNDRNSYSMIHYLLEPEEADALFLSAPHETLHAMIDHAIQLEVRFIDEGTIPSPSLPKNWSELKPYTIPEGTKLSTCAALLSAASYTEGLVNHNNEKQGFFITDDDPFRLISDALLWLPPFIRKRVSFSLNVESAPESNGCAINITTNDFSSNVMATLSEAQISTKYFYGGSAPAKEDATTIESIFDILHGLRDLPEGRYFRNVIASYVKTWNGFLSLSESLRATNKIQAFMSTVGEVALFQGLYAKVLDNPAQLYKEAVALKYPDLARKIGKAYPEVLPPVVKETKQQRSSYPEYSHMTERYVDSRISTPYANRPRVYEESHGRWKIFSAIREFMDRIPIRKITVGFGFAVSAAFLFLLFLFLEKQLQIDLKEVLHISEEGLKFAKLWILIPWILCLLLTATVWILIGKLWSGKDTANQKVNADRKKTVSEDTAPLSLWIPSTEVEKAKAITGIIQGVGNPNVDPVLLAELLHIVENGPTRKPSAKKKTRK